MDDNLIQRLLDFAAEIGWVCDELPDTRFGNRIAYQLSGSGTSPRPNYEEACGAESRKDFIHKMSISLKELRESHFWLRLISRCRLITGERIAALTDECNQLVRIFGQSVTTARRNDPSGRAWRRHPEAEQ